MQDREPDQIAVHQAAEPRSRQSGAGFALVWFLIAALGHWGGLDYAASRGPLGSIEKTAVSYLAGSETKAFEAFAVARTIDAAVSVLKSADLSIFVAQVAPMEALEPIDDLSKQFSDVMVLSLVAIMLQQVVLLIAQSWALSLVLPIGCVLLALGALLRGTPRLGIRLAGLGRAVIVLALFARFTVPFAGWIGNEITQKFIASDLDTNLSLMKSAGGNLDQISTSAAASAAATPAPSPPAQGGASPSLFGKWADGFQTLGTITQSVLARGEALAKALLPNKAAIDAFMTSLPRQIVKLIAIFLVQTVLTPFLVGFFFYHVLRRIVGPVR